MHGEPAPEAYDEPEECPHCGTPMGSGQPRRKRHVKAVVVQQMDDWPDDSRFVCEYCYTHGGVTLDAEFPDPGDAARADYDGTEQAKISDYAKRTRRAREDVDQVVRSGALWLVEGDEEAVYHVDAEEGTCDCPDHAYRGERCKHIRAVELRAGDSQ